MAILSRTTHLQRSTPTNLQSWNRLDEMIDDTLTPPILGTKIQDNPSIRNLIGLPIGSISL